MLVGVMILAVSATAAFGSVNGYAKYKTAVMALAMEEENFTANAHMTMTLDGETLLDSNLEGKLAAPNYAVRNTFTQNGQTYDEYYGTVDGTYTRYYNDNDYYSHTGDSGWTNLIGYEGGDEMSDRLITFLELAADTVMGDLKNNFVEVGSEGDSTLYQVNISDSQVPALVNAGLSLFAYTVAEDQQNTCYVTYEDYETSLFHQYETVTGQTLPEEFKVQYQEGFPDGYYTENEEMIDEFFQIEADWSESYWKVIEDKGEDGKYGQGIVYVYADGSYDYYPDGYAYAQAHADDDPLDDIYYYIGEDLVLDSIDCTFGLNPAGQLTSNQITVTFTATGLDGQHHELVMAVDLTVSDYGATVVEAPDLTGRVKAN